MGSALFEKAKAASGLSAGGRVDVMFCPTCNPKGIVPIGGFGYRIFQDGERIEYERGFLPWSKLHVHLVTREKSNA
jgi:hypothetical protein